MLRKELPLERIKIKDLFNSPLNCKYLKDIEVVVGRPEMEKIHFSTPRMFSIELERLNGTCALIGSRDIDREGKNALEYFGKKINTLGYVGLSGGANGADTIFEGVVDNMNVFLPWEKFNKRKEKITTLDDGYLCGVFNPENNSSLDKTLESIANEIEGNHYQYIEWS